MLFLSRYEGFGMPIVESMACGTPAVVSNCAALPEVAGNAGLIVGVDQPAEIAGILSRLSTDDAFRAEYAQRGIERARRFTWDACVTRLLGAMRDASA